MKVVVTGGAGFIGSNLAEELLKKHEVTIIDNLSTGRIVNLDQIIDKINFLEGSITDLDLLKVAFSGSDTVFHQAAIPSVQRSVDNPIASNGLSSNSGRCNQSMAQPRLLGLWDIGRFPR